MSKAVQQPARKKNMTQESGGVGRRERRKSSTRAALLEAAYAVMSRVGVDDAKLQDITEMADIAFGTFYNYFETKDDLARQVLDCMIDDMGRRNVQATGAIREADQALVIAVSIRLIMREAITDPIWRWWALRTDLLVERMRAGLYPFFKRDRGNAERAGLLRTARSTMDSEWSLTTWMMAGGIHDIVVGDKPSEHMDFVVAAILRMSGFASSDASRGAQSKLPPYPRSSINWSFALEDNAVATRGA